MPTSPGLGTKDLRDAIGREARRGVEHERLDARWEVPDLFDPILRRSKRERRVREPDAANDLLLHLGGERLLDLLRGHEAE